MIIRNSTSNGNGIKKKSKICSTNYTFLDSSSFIILATTYRTYNFRPRKTLSGFDRSSLKHPAYIVATSLKGRVLTTISQCCQTNGQVLLFASILIKVLDKSAFLGEMEKKKKGERFCAFSYAFFLHFSSEHFFSSSHRNKLLISFFFKY